ncbi:hypothetical protein [Aquamicrobium soli]|uniref:Uncharacterized protein n=1 Tax=Aquamicrobium soli TaxID=1811518 RepID=A0ABV7KB76_9HYPH
MEKSKDAPAKRGRPAYRPTLKERETVEQMKFCGESENTIARSLGIDVGTLRKHFGEELENGHANRRREVIGYLFEAASSKNVAAIKKLEEMGRVASAADAVKARETKAPKLGKKEERRIAAENVGGKFATPAPPKLVVNNGK